MPSGLAATPLLSPRPWVLPTLSSRAQPRDLGFDLEDPSTSVGKAEAGARHLDRSRRRSGEIFFMQPRFCQFESK